MAPALAVLLLLSAWPATAAASQSPSPRQVTAISVTHAGNVTLVSIEGDGALPEPIAGAVDNPPRIFFDFPGVLTKTRGTPAAANPFVRRVRAAVHNSEPLVTRVVIDLLAEATFQIDRSSLAAGRLTVRVGQQALAATPVPQIPEPPAAKPAAEERPSLAPVTPLPPPSSARTPAPAPPPRPEPVPSSGTGLPPSPPEPTGGHAKPALPAPAAAPPPSSSGASQRRAGSKYHQQLGEALDRARTLRPVLSTIDRLASQPVDALENAAAEFETIRRILGGVKAQDSLRATHDMVVRACTLGAMAARLRADGDRTGDETTLRNAASAAAGALLLIDRACVELGCNL